MCYVSIAKYNFRKVNTSPRQKVVIHFIQCIIYIKHVPGEGLDARGRKASETQMVFVSKEIRVHWGWGEEPIAYYSIVQ